MFCVAKIEMSYSVCIFLCRSDGSLVPDGENFVVAASKLPSGGALDSVESPEDSKPVEEISYGLVVTSNGYVECQRYRNVDN